MLYVVSPEDVFSDSDTRSTGSTPHDSNLFLLPQNYNLQHLCVKLALQ